MGRPDTITMSMRELDRCKVIQAVVDDGLMVWRAAEKLGISKRQVERLVLRYREDGPQGLCSRKWGQPGHHQLPPGLESRVCGLIRDSYADFGPTLAAEKLRERHGIEISKACVRRIMIDAGFWVPRRQRPPKVHQPRNRRACLGELVQIDGSDHAWFEDRAPACTLLVYVDDATGRLMQLLFVPTESTQAYFTATRAYVDTCWQTRRRIESWRAATSMSTTTLTAESSHGQTVLPCPTPSTTSYRKSIRGRSSITSVWATCCSWPNTCKRNATTAVLNRSRPRTERRVSAGGLLARSLSKPWARGKACCQISWPSLIPTSIGAPIEP
ncbi:hypothetical protein LBM2029_20315 (plasmid) [Ralstonia solanacearum]|nr:hypothetical protein LBM2029_20315 [Ralstonia solanacearum]